MYKLRYTVSKEPKTNLWYAHMTGYPNIPVFDSEGTFGTKRHALEIAAACSGLIYREYMELRKKCKDK